MKRKEKFFTSLHVLLLLGIALLFTSCSKEDAPDSLREDEAHTEIPFTVTASDNSTVWFAARYAYTETFHFNNTCIYASTSGTSATMLGDVEFCLWMKTNNLREATLLRAVSIEEFKFYNPLSGSSDACADRCTGKVYLLEYNVAESVMRLRMDNVECVVSGVKFTFHGDFECSIVDSPMNG